jgi:hypothetical protein
VAPATPGGPRFILLDFIVVSIVFSFVDNGPIVSSIVFNFVENLSSAVFNFASKVASFSPCIFLF